MDELNELLARADEWDEVPGPAAPLIADLATALREADAEIERLRVALTAPTGSEHVTITVPQKDGTDARYIIRRTAAAPSTEEPDAAPKPRSGR